MSHCSLVLVDASPYIFRAYFALPATLRTPEGRPAQAVYGFADTLIRLLAEERPSHLAVCFDGSLTTCFRNEIFPEYKAQREPPPTELVAQLDDCQNFARALGCTTFVSDRYEADDLVATLLTRHRSEIDTCTVVSSDKDLGQLVDTKVQWYDLAKGRRYGPAEVLEHFGVPPNKLLDLLALRGDPVDNIPGVAGIGDKTARALLQHFDGVEDLYSRLAQVEGLAIRGAKSVAKKLHAQHDRALLSQRLARLEDEVPLETSLSELRYRGLRPVLFDPLCERLGFDGIRRRAQAAAHSLETPRP